jgi:DNA-binding MurR/RpiR family transcriptional regulator
MIPCRIRREIVAVSQRRMWSFKQHAVILRKKFHRLPDGAAVRRNRTKCQFLLKLSAGSDIIGGSNNPFPLFFVRVSPSRFRGAFHIFASILASCIIICNVTCIFSEDCMTLIGKISDQAKSLTPSERKLVQTVIDSPTAAALGTAGELAKSVGVHEATASRLAKKLGFDSYAAFRNALRNEFLATRETATRFEKTIAENTSGTILGQLARDEALAFGRIEEFITTEQITETAQTLMNARRIFVYGYGNAEVLALMMVKRFRRFGKDVQQLENDPRGLAEQLLGLEADDVVLSFAFRRPPRGYAALVETAKDANARTIIISDDSGAFLTPQPDHILAAPRSGDLDAFQTLTVPMTVCNAIIIAAGLTAKEESLKKLDRLGQLIERFE